MYLIKLKALLLSSIVLTACSTGVEIPTPLANDKPIILPPENPRPINTKPVEFTVVTQNNREKLDSEPVWYSMTTQSYENLAYNMQELIRYITQQQNQINYYKNNTPN
jgi:hypothetical protein